MAKSAGHPKGPDHEADGPVEGGGRYFHFALQDATLDDIARSYENVYEEHRDVRDVKDRIAFHDRERSGIEIPPAE